MSEIKLVFRLISSILFNIISLATAAKLGQGNVFTGVCDSVHRGGVCMLGYHPPGADTASRSRHPPGVDTPPLEQTPPPQSRHPPWEADSGIRSTSDRYASYWNAFLFYSKHTLRGLYPNSIAIDSNQITAEAYHRNAFLLFCFSVANIIFKKCIFLTF